MKRSRLTLILVLGALLAVMIFSTASAAWYETKTTQLIIWDEDHNYPVFDLKVKTKYGLTGNYWIKCDTAWQVKDQLYSGYWLENDTEYDGAFGCEPDNFGEDVWVDGFSTWSKGDWLITYNSFPVGQVACNAYGYHDYQGLVYSANCSYFYW